MPFINLLLANVTYLKINYLVQNFASLLAAVNALFLNVNKSQNKNGLDFFTITKCMLALLGLFTDKNDRFPKCLIHLRPVQGTPFGQSLPILAHHRDYPLGYTQLLAIFRLCLRLGRCCVNTMGPFWGRVNFAPVSYTALQQPIREAITSPKQLSEVSAQEAQTHNSLLEVKLQGFIWEFIIRSIKQLKCR